MSLDVSSEAEIARNFPPGSSKLSRCTVPLGLKINVPPSQRLLMPSAVERYRPDKT
jgi:hypothetical protein